MSKGNTQTSLIAMLAKRRDGVFQQARFEDGRGLIDREWDYVFALDYVIANTPAATKADAIIQSRIAAEIAECHCEGRPASLWIESLQAAVTSISAVLAPRRAA